MKMAVVGNSHLAALKLAVQRHLFSQEGLYITFWGLPGPEFNAVSYSAGMLQTPYKSLVLHISDGLYESLPVREFDAIFFHGVALNVGEYLLSLRKGSEHLRCYSDALLRDGLRSRIQQMPSWSLVRSLRADFHGRLLMSAMPLSSEDGAKFNGILVTEEELARLNHHIGGVLGEIGVEYLPQPPDTIRDSKYTKREFCVDSVRLAPKLCHKHPDDDYVHMNEQYGVRVLQAVGTRLSARSSV